MLISFDKRIVNRDKDIIFKYIESSYLQQVVDWIINTLKGTKVNLKGWLKEQVDNPTEGLLKVASLIQSNEDIDTQVSLVQEWVVHNLDYTSDTTQWKIPDKWSPADETINSLKGDCIAEYEEIYTKEGIKSAKDIKVGDIVLSYDFKNKKFCYKSIINKWDKGKLNIKRVHFRNGQHIDVTENHHMAVRNNQKCSNYIKQDLKDIDLTRWWTRKVPIAKEMPYKIMDIEELNEELCVVLGHFLAEGYCGKSKVQSCGYELIEYIIPLLEKNSILFTESKNNSGVPTINFLKGWFKDLLKLQKNNSFDIHLQENLFHLPKRKLEKILYGAWLGDGTKLQYNDKRGYKNSKEWTYSTSSVQLANDIQRIGLQLGRTFHIWKQEHHQGLGKNPIYRINYNTESHFLKDFGYKDISEVSISYMEDLGKFQTYDWEVEDTHTFVFKNGIITFQCEDGAILTYILCRLKGVPTNRLLIFAGDVDGGGHCWLGFRPTAYPLNFTFMDWCYWANLQSCDERNKFYIQGQNIHEFKNDQSEVQSNYYKIWFGCNEEFSTYSINYTFQGILNRED